jgi:hypothetical protein
LNYLFIVVQMEVNPNANGGASFSKENGTQSIDMSPDGSGGNERTKIDLEI